MWLFGIQKDLSYKKMKELKAFVYFWVHISRKKQHIRCIAFCLGHTQKWLRKSNAEEKILNYWRIYSWQLQDENALLGFTICKDGWGKLRMTQSLPYVGCLL